MDRLDGDYIEVDDTGSEVDLLSELVELLRPSSVNTSGEQFPLLVLERGTEVTYDNYAYGLTRLAIFAAGEARSDRRGVVASIYQLLADHTRWALIWTSDEERGVIASRGYNLADDRLRKLGHPATYLRSGRLRLDGRSLGGS